MSETCILHQWQHAYEPCPQCIRALPTYTHSGGLSAPTEMLSLRLIREKLDVVTRDTAGNGLQLLDVQKKLDQIFDVQAYILRCDDYLGAELKRLATIIEEAALMEPPRKAKKGAR